MTYRRGCGMNSLSRGVRWQRRLTITALEGVRENLLHGREGSIQVQCVPSCFAARAVELNDTRRSLTWLPLVTGGTVL